MLQIKLRKGNKSETCIGVFKEGKRGRVKKNWFEVNFIVMDMKIGGNRGKEIMLRIN